MFILAEQCLKGMMSPSELGVLPNLCEKEGAIKPQINFVPVCENRGQELLSHELPNFKTCAAPRQLFTKYSSHLEIKSPSPSMFSFTPFMRLVEVS